MFTKTLHICHICGTFAHSDATWIFLFNFPLDNCSTSFSGCFWNNFHQQAHLHQMWCGHSDFMRQTQISPNTDEVDAREGNNLNNPTRRSQIIKRYLNGGRGERNHWSLIGIGITRSFVKHEMIQSRFVTELVCLCFTLTIGEYFCKLRHPVFVLVSVSGCVINVDMQHHINHAELQFLSGHLLYENGAAASSVTFSGESITLDGVWIVIKAKLKKISWFSLSWISG